MTEQVHPVVPDGTATRLAALIATTGLDAGDRGVSALEPEHRFEAERTISRLALLLARLHHTAIVDVRPRDELTGETQHGGDRLVVTPEDLVRRASLGSGEVGPAYRHMSRERLVQILSDGAAAMPVRAAGLVLVHGAPTLANLRVDGPDTVGLADWSRAGLGDPYLDLAVAARDVAAVFGPAPIQAFFGEYGLERPDPVRLDWYLLAAELCA